MGDLKILFIYIRLCLLTDLQPIADLNALRRANTFIVRWNHDKDTDPCSVFVDYVVEYRLTNVRGCSEMLDSQVTRESVTDKEVTIENLEYYSDYIITVTARRRAVRYDNTAQTVSQVTEQAGRLNLVYFQETF